MAEDARKVSDVTGGLYLRHNLIDGLGVRNAAAESDGSKKKAEPAHVKYYARALSEITGRAQRSRWRSTRAIRRGCMVHARR